MDAIVGVWLTSLLGATAFSAAGYILGQRGVFVPFLGLAEPPPRSEVPSPVPKPDLHTMPTPPVGIPRSELVKRETIPSSKPPVPSSKPPILADPAETPLTLPVAPLASQRPKPGGTSASGRPLIPREEPDDDEERPTVVPDTRTQAAAVAAAVATIPPPRTPSIRIGMMDDTSTNADLEAALEKADAAAQRARAAEAVKFDLERQIETLRAELRNEVVARATATARAEELGDRLASASEDAASLRHKVSLLDKQTKQLREALQGRVRALTTSEWHRRRDLEEAEEVRVKLRDVYEKLERSSLPPSGTSVPPPSTSQPPSSSMAPGRTTSPGMPAVPRSVNPNGDEVTSLRDQVTRLTKENRELRERALGSMPPRRSEPPSAAELDMAGFRELLERVGSVAGLEGAVLAAEPGSLLLGSGDLAEGMAAFGAYIRDASSRTDRLLPLEGVEEVDIRDRRGRLLSTRVLSHSPSELCLVFLGSADASLVAAKNIVDEHLRLRQP